MNAKEARVKSKEQLVKFNKTNSRNFKKEKIKRIESAKQSKIIYYKNLLEGIQNSIKSATNSGKNKTTYFLATPDKAFESDEEYFLSHFKYKKEVKRVMTYFKNKGFTVMINSIAAKHDSSVAYLNSGGECGSMEPYWNNDTEMRISW